MNEVSLRLFAEEAPKASDRSSIQVIRGEARRPAAPIPEPPPVIEVVAAPQVATVPTLAKRVAREQDILDAFDAPATQGERATDTFRRKEYAIAAVFATLTVDDARLLHRRLSRPDPEDPIAQRFSRLVVERRTRLLDFLGDAGRRALLARGRK